MNSLELDAALPIHPTLLHPRTGQPLRAVGVLPSGRIVWPIMGGDGSEADANVDGGEDPAGNEDPDGTEPPEGEDTDEPDQRVKRANKQAADYRGQLRETQTALQTLQAQQEKIMGALRAATGLEPEAEADPAAQVTELTGQVTNLSSDLAAAQAELLVFRLAGANGANPNALVDSRGFAKTLAGLDASASDYEAKVTEAIKAAVAANPAYRAGSGKGGAELDAAGREAARKTRPGLAGAIANAYKS